MRFIGITGGVGAGKSAILTYLAEKPKTKVMLADEIAHRLMEPGEACYEAVAEAFAGEDILVSQEAGAPFDREKLAKVIFAGEERRAQLNAIVHPAVKEYVRDIYRQEQGLGRLELLVLEAALLIEENYDEICDELWYIYTDEDNRRKRLRESRGYSEEKIDSIMASQLTEEQFRNGTQVTIDNNGGLEDTFRQIERALRREADE